MSWNFSVISFPRCRSNGTMYWSTNSAAIHEEATCRCIWMACILWNVYKCNWHWVYKIFLANDSILHSKTIDWVMATRVHTHTHTSTQTQYKQNTEWNVHFLNTLELYVLCIYKTTENGIWKKNDKIATLISVPFFQTLGFCIWWR